MCSITLYPLRYFDDIWYACISGQDEVSLARIVAIPYWSLESFLLNEFYRGSLCAQNCNNL